MNMISEKALAALRSTEVVGNKVKLNGQLERSVYVEINKVLEKLGGKWDRKSKMHVFVGDPYDGIATVNDTGEMPKSLSPVEEAKLNSYFPTPESVLRQALDLAGGLDKIPVGGSFLEPSAGEGAILKFILTERSDLHPTIVEINDKRRDKLTSNYPDAVVRVDFMLDIPVTMQFDLIVMNPPFTVPGDKLAWFHHTFRALHVLKPGGLLIAILPSSITFRQNMGIPSMYELFRGLDGECEPLEPGAFKESGTMVNAVIATYHKPSK